MNRTKFSINFYDASDHEPGKEYTGEQIAKSVNLANQNFGSIRTIFDFNEGDPGQYVGSAFQPIPGKYLNVRNTFWQDAIRSTDMDVVLTIENPQKWLNSIDLAISYLYQFVLPLSKNFIIPEKYPPQFYGNPTNHAALRYDIVKNYIKGIVVGLEVGTHINVGMPEGQFKSKADIVSNLDKYVRNLLDALDLVGLKDIIEVTSSFAPSNADKTAEELAKDGFYEFIVQKDGVYSLNQEDYQVDGIDINFSKVVSALNIIKTEQSANQTGILLSVYSYWQYQPDVDMDSKTPVDWMLSTEKRFLSISEPFINLWNKDEMIENITNPCSIGEIGWPTSGSNSVDNSPNKPSSTVCQNLLKGLLLWSGQDSSPNYIHIWQLTDLEADSSTDINNPERYYGFYENGLKDQHNPIKFPELSGLFKEGMLAKTLKRIFDEFPNIKKLFT